MVPDMKADSSGLAHELEEAAEYIRINCHPQCAVLLGRAAWMIRELEARLDAALPVIAGHSASTDRRNEGNPRWVDVIEAK